MKELLTAVVSIEALCKSFRRRKIILFIDNTAAAGVIRRLASTTAHGNELAKRIDAALTSECSLTVVTVLTEHNPADSPTRNKPICSVRVAAMWETWDNFQRGLVCARAARSVATNVRLRHRETEEPEDDFDSDDEEDSEDVWPDITTVDIED